RRGAVDLREFPAPSRRGGWPGGRGGGVNATLNAGGKKEKDKPEATAGEKPGGGVGGPAPGGGAAVAGAGGGGSRPTQKADETAANQEMTEPLGHDKHGLVTSETGNVRNGPRAKTVLTEASGQVGIEVPRDRQGTFEPQIVKKRQRRLTGVDEIVLSLYAKG